MSFAEFFIDKTSVSFETMAMRGYQRDAELKRDFLSNSLDKFSMSNVVAQSAIRAMGMRQRALYAAKYIFWVAIIGMDHDTDFDLDDAMYVALSLFASLTENMLHADIIDEIIKTATGSIYETMNMRRQLTFSLMMEQNNQYVH